MGEYIFGDLSTDSWRRYEEYIRSQSDEDYIVNESQMEKFTDSIQFIIEQAKKNSGIIEPIRIEPRRRHGGLTAFFSVLYLNGDDLNRFSDIVKNLSAFSIDAGDGERFCISFTVPDVYVRKK